jgi:hypothetical protein
MFGNDPFFSDPFAHMDRMMTSMLNDPFFANPLGVALQPAMPYSAPYVQQPRVRCFARQDVQSVPAVNHVPYTGAQGSQPVIEEVDDAGNLLRSTSAQDEPIVEEPDDGESSGASRLLGALTCKSLCRQPPRWLCTLHVT